MTRFPGVSNRRKARGGDNYGRKNLETKSPQNGGGTQKTGASPWSSPPCQGAENKLAQWHRKGQLYSQTRKTALRNVTFLPPEEEVLNRWPERCRFFLRVFVIFTPLDFSWYCRRYNFYKTAPAFDVLNPLSVTVIRDVITGRLSYLPFLISNYWIFFDVWGKKRFTSRIKLKKKVFHRRFTFFGYNQRAF